MSRRCLLCHRGAASPRAYSSDLQQLRESFLMSAFLSIIRTSVFTKHQKHTLFGNLRPHGINNSRTHTSFSVIASLQQSAFVTWGVTPKVILDSSWLPEPPGEFCKTLSFSRMDPTRQRTALDWSFGQLSRSGCSPGRSHWSHWSRGAGMAFLTPTSEIANTHFISRDEAGQAVDVPT